MKTLEHQTLLYDEDCPLCQIYTSGFIKVGMLDENGRKPFTRISKNEEDYIDMQRATNEIALVDNQNKTVIYGVDSLLKVIGYRFPFVANISKFKPIHFFLKKLYAFISYNRKVIIPSQRNQSKVLQCVPSFNVTYRLLYILFSVIISMLTLFHFSKNISTLPQASWLRESFVTVGQLIFQGVFLYTLDKKIILNYFGNIMTVSLMGSLLLLPLLILNSIIPISEIILLMSFAIIVIIMFLEHKRRVRILNLPSYLSYTWILYRLLIVFTILNFNS